MSSGRFSISLTFGFREKASTSPDTHPAAIIGFKEVKGAARTEDKMVKGCAKAMSAPRPASRPFARIHHFIMSFPVLIPP